MENSPSLASNATNPPPNTTTTATSTTLDSPSIAQPTAPVPLAAPLAAPPASTPTEASSASTLNSEPIHIIGNSFVNGFRAFRNGNTSAP